MQKKKEINVAIGTRIQLVREERGYTQEQLAEMLDVGVQHISNIERGVTGISLAALCRVCEILQISSDFLLFGRSEAQVEDSIDAQIRSFPLTQATLVRQGIEMLLKAIGP